MISVSLTPPMRLFQLKVPSENSPAQPPAPTAQEHFAASNALRVPAVISFSPAPWHCGRCYQRHTHLLRGHHMGDCDREDFSRNRQRLWQVWRWKVSFQYPLDQERLQLSIILNNKIETNLGVTSGSKELPKKVCKNKQCVLNETNWHCNVQIQIFLSSTALPSYFI